MMMIDNRCRRRGGGSGDGGVTHPRISYMVGNNGLGLELCTGLHQEQLNWRLSDIIITEVSIRVFFSRGAAAQRRPWPPHERGF